MITTSWSMNAGDSESPILVENNEATQRFEVSLPEGDAYQQYRYNSRGAIVLIHTQVPESLRGKGIATAIARASLEFAKTHHLEVVPICPVVQAFLRRHPEFQSLVKPENEQM